MQIRKLIPEEAPLFQELRLRGLKDHPEAFGESHDEFASQSAEEIARRIQPASGSRTGFVLGAFDGEARLVGVVALTRDSARKRFHKAILWGMYVLPEYRRQRLATRLVRALIGFAREFGDLEQIQLTVAARNERAVRLYESLGFRSYGREPRALCINGEYFDQEHMVLVLGERESTITSTNPQG